MYIERKRPEDEEDFTNTREFKKKKVFSSVISFYIFTTHRLIKNKIKNTSLASLAKKTFLHPNVDLSNTHLM